MTDNKMISMTAVAIVTIILMGLMAIPSDPGIADTIAGFIGCVGIVVCGMIQWTQ